MKPRAAVFQSGEIKRVRLMLARWPYDNKNRFYANSWTPRASRMMLRLRLNDLNSQT